MTMRVIGKRTPRIEGPDKVSGRLRFAADLAPESCLWGRVLRSPHAHARIVRIDTSAAERVPGVHAVLTGADHPHWIGRFMRDLPVLAIDKVRFIGERVVAVAAESADAANEALALIEVEYEELAAVFDVPEALAPDAPLVHDDPTQYAGAFVHPERPALPNLCSYGRWTHGDVEAALAGSHRVFENTFVTQKEHHVYMETHACAVSVHPDGTADVWASNKSPHMLRGQIAAAMGVEAPSIRVHPMPVGGDFGGKGSPMDTPVAYLLSQATGRPVKIVMSYQEELLAANTRHPGTIMVRTGVTEEGNVTGMQMEAYFDSGAYGAFKPAPNVNLHGLEQAGSCYRFTALDVTSHIVYTNTLPSGHMRSPGGPQVNFAVESQLNIIAAELGLDAAEFRRRNLLRPGDTAPNGEQWGAIKAVEALDAAVEAIGWSKPKAPYTGRGVSLYERGPIGGDSSCRLVLHPDASLTLYVPIADPGQGAYTAMQQVIAEELGVEPETIKVLPAPTDELTFDFGVSGSRTTFALGVTVQESINTLRAQLREAAGDAPFAEAAAELCRANGGDVAVNTYKKVPLFPDPPTTEFTAQAAEVEVDPETGNVTVRRIVSAHDVGTIINPEGHRGQILGGAIQGLGMATVEEHIIEDGRPVALNLADYKIPNIADIPAFETVLIPSGEGPGPFNAGAIAESANVPTASAIANAVHDAIGIPVRSLPLTAERVYNMLQEQGERHG